VIDKSIHQIHTPSIATHPENKTILLGVGMLHKAAHISGPLIMFRSGSECTIIDTLVMEMRSLVNLCLLKSFVFHTQTETELYNSFVFATCFG
jgi:hypothetical protein